MIKNKDWTGNSNSVWKTLGASNHTNEEREPNEFYATSPIAIDLLAKKVVTRSIRQTLSTETTAMCRTSSQ